MPQLGETIGFRVGERLPDLRLPRPDGEARALRGPHRDAVVVVALHDIGCDRCRRYLRELAAARPRFRIWDGSVRAVTDAADQSTVGGLQADVGLGVDVLVDTGRTLLDRVGSTDGPAVLVADRYGQLFEIFAGGSGHALPRPRELEEWLQYLATQCPE